MYKTLQMMKQIVIGNERKVPESELIEKYRNDKSPNILAYFYVANYGICYVITEKYPLLDTADKASFCLQELDNALHTYDSNKYNITFSNFYAACIKRRLFYEQARYKRLKRDMRIKYENIDDCKTELSYVDDHFDFDDFSKEYNLNNIEQAHCKLLMKGHSMREISKLINKSIYRTYGINKEIRKKLKLNVYKCS